MACILLSRDIGGVPIDVVLSEDHTSEMEIAEHPVERGAKISDHAWRKPAVVRLESIVDQDRAMSAFQALLDVQHSAEPFDIVTGLRVYNDMLIQSLNAIRDPEHARILKVTAELREVIIVSASGGGGGSGGGLAGLFTGAGFSGSFDRGQVQALDAVLPGNVSASLSALGIL